MSQKSQTVFRATATQNNYSYLLKQSTTSTDSLSYQNQIFQKVRNIIKGDEDNFLNKFQMQDINNNGFISNLQFKKNLRYLGLNSKDIDTLFIVIEQRNGQVNYKEFCRRLLNKKQEDKINQRPKEILEKLKTDIIYYVINIKDAFKRVK